MPTKQQCQDWGDAIRRQCESFYGPRLEAVRNLISEAVAKGQDPKKVQLEDGIATIDYEALLKDNESAKKQAQEAAETQQKSCDDGAAPNWIGDAQKMTDGALVVAMLPFLVLTQRYASMKIDLFEVYKGRPLGGDNALIPKVREEILDSDPIANSGIAS